ncbi:MAG: YchJ family protein [Bacteriovoracaceae bacterium]|nr:YchJ family protein [Bacteriovoracaceae bacterium]
MKKCPCGGADYNNCCGPYISGERLAPSPETVMRARYSAYANGEVDFIKKSYHPDKLSEFDEKGVREWSANSTWQGLEIVKTSGGLGEEEEGTVEFVASYSMDGADKQHHELSTFKKTDGVWYFLEGQNLNQGFRRTTQKIGRNDPCLCGSGKKYKKCCFLKS